MADYYPLIARAIAGLDPSAPGESRRALYERARAALIAQLRSVEPPLSESEITRERLSLEEAVRKVESEAAQRARDASRAPGCRRAPRPGPAMRCAPTPVLPARSLPSRRHPLRHSQPRVHGRRRRRQPRNDRAAAGAGRPQDRGAQPPSGDAAPSTAGFDAGSATAADPRAAGAPRRGSDNNVPQAPGMRGFRDITADADDLGRAAAQASRAARKTYANVPSPSPEFDRLEPVMENRGVDPDAPYSYDESVEEAERYAPARPRRVRGWRRTEAASRNGRSDVSVQERDCGRHRPDPGRRRDPVGQVGRQHGERPVQIVADRRSRRPRIPARHCTKPKIPDRVGQPSSSDQVAPVAQRVVLYDEDPSDPKGKQYVGSVIWRTEQIKATGSQKADLAVRADIEIPDRKFKMTMSFRRNTDTSLPASHTAELTFILPPDFSGGGVSNVPGILMKSNEQARGTPLAGLAVKVTDGFFLVGPVECRCRPLAQPAALEGALLVRRAAGLCQPAPRHHRHREGRPRRARLQRRVRGLGRVGAWHSAFVRSFRLRYDLKYPR